MLTQAEVRSLFNYDPETGELVNRVTRTRALAGGKTGRLNASGYLVVGINGKTYYAHRLVWLLVYGYLPENGVDHINRNRSDNRLANLREVSMSCNLRNAKQFSSNTSGVTGVSWFKRCGKWQVYIAVNNRQHCLGKFTDFTEAVLHRLAAEQCLNWEGCDSSSDAFRYLQEIRYGQRETE